MGTNYQISIIIGVGGRSGRNNWGQPLSCWNPVYDVGGCERGGSGGGLRGQRADMGKLMDMMHLGGG